MFELSLNPVSRSILKPGEIEDNQWGRKISYYEGGNIDVSTFDVAILGIEEDRANIHNKGCSQAPDAIRKQLQKLYVNIPGLNIVDLGNLKIGKTVKDTYFGLASLMFELLKGNTTTIILGGSHDLTYAQYLAYQELYEMVNLVVIDEKIDVEKVKDHQMKADSFLWPIFMHQPNFLFDYCHLGYQKFLTDEKAVETLESLSFECHRLGSIKGNIESIEPFIRSADLLSLDISCIRSSDAPGHQSATPNGFFGEEICQIAKYAGYSDLLSSFGIYEMNPLYDNREQTANLVAQIVWHFIEGFYNRKGDLPERNMENFIKYTVKFENLDHNIIFWKSKVSERWWMELPYGDKEKYHRQQLVPCSYEDYLKACKEELPDRWMKAYQKLV